MAPKPDQFAYETYYHPYKPPVAPVFPLAFVPVNSWAPGSAYNAHFGAPRNDGLPPHGACDLFEPANTPIYAVDDGVIIRGPYQFLESATKDKDTGQINCAEWVFAIDVRHTDFVVRYGEIKDGLPKGLGVGFPVSKGQVIAYVGRQCDQAMLHFEMFKDVNDPDYLTDFSNPKYLYVPQRPYMRRKDLLDPTSYLDEWLAQMQMQQMKTRVDKLRQGNAW